VRCRRARWFCTFRAWCAPLFGRASIVRFSVSADGKLAAWDGEGVQSGGPEFHEKARWILELSVILRPPDADDGQNSGHEVPDCSCESGREFRLAGLGLTRIDRILG
jgi:hypothetical protein